MNLILLEKMYRQEILKHNDRRVVHIKGVLRMNVGDYLYVGVEGGSIGKALIKEDDEGGMLLEVDTYWKSLCPSACSPTGWLASPSDCQKTATRNSLSRCRKDHFLLGGKVRAFL